MPFMENESFPSQDESLKFPRPWENPYVLYISDAAFLTISDGIPELDFFYHPISNNIVSIHLKPHHKDKIDFH